MNFLFQRVQASDESFEFNKTKSPVNHFLIRPRKVKYLSCRFGVSSPTEAGSATLALLFKFLKNKEAFF